MPEMVPVSYPNRTPPKATKKPMTMAGHALPATPSGLAREMRRRPAILRSEFYAGLGWIALAQWVEKNAFEDGA